VRLRRVVSGGQTGVDRAALDAAAAAGLARGGWCPAGRWAEDGRIADGYPLRETPSSEPAQRTAWNVRDSDATLLLATMAPTGGSALTLAEARRRGRPVLAVDPRSAAEVAETRRWLRDAGIAVLNVAGPRESESPGIYALARTFLDALFASMNDTTRRVLITGGAGLLGRHLIRNAPVGVMVHATRRRTPAHGAEVHTVDLADAAATRDLFTSLRPDLVVHTAYSVAEPEADIWAATCSVVEGCLETGAGLIYLSTDALLDGERAPYDEAADPAPVHEYGRWKARAEKRVREALPDAAVVRTSLITEFDPPDPRCAWVADSLRAGRSITLFTDELRCPIAAEDLALQLWELAELSAEERAGIWNLAGPEAVSRYTLGLMIAAHFGLDPSGLQAVPSAASPSPRPRDLRLLTSRADAALRTRARPVGMLVGGGRTSFEEQGSLEL
jgi:dTDP-4-dehydrorhamnose reductase